MWGALHAPRQQLFDGAAERVMLGECTHLLQVSMQEAHAATMVQDMCIPAPAD